MAEEEDADIARFFTDVVPDDLARAYAKLSAAGGVAKDHAAEFLGGERLVEELTARGMAHALPHTPAAPATFQAASPELALHGVLADFQARLAELQKLLFEGQRRLAEARSRPVRIGDGSPDHLVRILTNRDEIMRTSMHLINSAQRDWMTLETAETAMPITDDYPVDATTALRQNVRIRSIYDTVFIEHPVASRFVEDAVKAGEEARILPEVPMKMQLADARAVLLPLTQNGTEDLCIADGPIPPAMRNFFEMLWTRGTPFGSTAPADVPLDKNELLVLQLMAAGKPDEAIAKSMRLHRSTVRRHIRAIAARLDLKNPSRFTLGHAVGRRGWLVCPSDNTATDKDQNA
ncbi:MAG TPA: LuxR C-terminal-related transcriptional regulator [Streptosporangiaceae bacterium]